MYSSATKSRNSLADYASVPEVKKNIDYKTETTAHISAAYRIKHHFNRKDISNPFPQLTELYIFRN